MCREELESSAKRRWNLTADKFNQWSELSQEEKDKLVYWEEHGEEALAPKRTTEIKK